MRNIIYQIKKLFSTYCKHPATALKKTNTQPATRQRRGEISLLQNRQLSFDEREGSASNSASSSTISRVLKEKAPLRSNTSLPISMLNGIVGETYKSSMTVLEVLRDLDADLNHWVYGSIAGLESVT